jgi:hypothetical protein
MNKISSLVTCLIATTLLCVASVSPSHAATTVYVSGQAGANDTNACTLASPCRSIGYATGIAGNGGTVRCLDAGPYPETFTATTSFTLDCEGVVYYSGNNFAIAVVQAANAPVIRFRHVIFDGAQGGNGAIIIQGGGNVVFDNCTFQNFTGDAVWFQPDTAGAHLTVTRSVFANNGGTGVSILPTSGVKGTAVIERSQFAGNTFGIYADGSNGPALVEVRYSSVAGSSRDGIWANTSGYVASIVVAHSASNQNGGSGILAQGGSAYVSLNDSTVDWNATGLTTASGGLIISYQDNLIAGNPSPGVTPLGIGRQ